MRLAPSTAYMKKYRSFENQIRVYLRRGKLNDQLRLLRARYNNSLGAAWLSNSEIIEAFFVDPSVDTSLGFPDGIQFKIANRPDETKIEALRKREGREI